MRVHKVNDKAYRLPNVLTEFQLRLYVHLIDWKWKHLTDKAGAFRGQYYDALLPAELVAQHRPLYPPIVARFLEHQRDFPFKSHRFFGHMASSQAACVNLFLPLLDMTPFSHTGHKGSSVCAKRQTRMRILIWRTPKISPRLDRRLNR